MPLREPNMPPAVDSPRLIMSKLLTSLRGRGGGGAKTQVLCQGWQGKELWDAAHLSQHCPNLPIVMTDHFGSCHSEQPPQHSLIM